MPQEFDEPLLKLFNEFDYDDQFDKERETIRTTPKLHDGLQTNQKTETDSDKGFIQETAVISSTSVTNSSSDIHELLFESKLIILYNKSLKCRVQLRNHIFLFIITENYELLYFYIFLAITLIVLVSVILIVLTRIIISKRNHNHEIKSQISNSILPLRNDLENMSEENDLSRPISIISSLTRDDVSI